MIERDEYDGPEEFEGLDELPQGEDEALEDDEEYDAELNADVAHRHFKGERT